MRTGTVFLRGRTWWVQYTVGGRQFRESACTDDEMAAREFLVQKRAEKEREVGGQRVVRLDDLRELVERDQVVAGRKCPDRARHAFLALTAHWGPRFSASTLTPVEIERYVIARLKARARSTVRLEVAYLARGLRLARRAGLLTTVPEIPRVSPSPARQGFLEDAEIARVIRGLTGEWKALVQFLAWTGWRWTEARLLRWDSVDWSSGCLRLLDTKSGRPRVLPFSLVPDLVELLTAQRKRTEAVETLTGRTIPWVFCSKDGEPVSDSRKRWETACKRAGVKALIHDLRRSAVRRMERAGISRSVAMRITGHRTEGIYARYAISSEADVAQALAAVVRAFRESVQRAEEKEEESP